MERKSASQKTEQQEEIITGGRTGKVVGTRVEEIRAGLKEIRGGPRDSNILKGGMIQGLGARVGKKYLEN